MHDVREHCSEVAVMRVLLVALFGGLLLPLRKCNLLLGGVSFTLYFRSNADFALTLDLSKSASRQFHGNRLPRQFPRVT